MSAPPTNPVTERLMRLDRQWNDAMSRPEVRLVRWLLAPDEVRMMDAFVHPGRRDGDQVTDRFITVDAPFEDPARHGPSMLAAVQEAGAAIPAEDQGVLALAEGLRRAEGARMLVFDLAPAVIADPAVWQQWLGRLAQRLPGNLRAMVRVPNDPDHREREDPPGVLSLTAGLDMPAALEELTEHAATDDPGSRLRAAMMKLARSLGTGNRAAIDGHARAAIAIAGPAGWTHQVFAIHALRAQAHTAGGDQRAAMDAHRSALAALRPALDSGDRLARSLYRQGLLGGAASLVAGGRWAAAARVYADAAGHAGSDQDTAATVDAWRMVSVCRLQSGHPAVAVEAAARAFSAAERLSAEDRDRSALPQLARLLYAGIGDRRLLEPLAPQLRGLLGSDRTPPVAPTGEDPAS